MTNRFQLLVKISSRFFAIFLFAFSLNLNSQNNVYAQSNIERAEVEKIIREYLLANPELLFEVQQAFEQKQETALAAQQSVFIDQHRDFLMQGDYQIVFGNPNAAMTIVEFFDYNCHFCQSAMKDMQKVVKEDPNVRFVLKEFPVLGPDSIQASQVSMAFSVLKPEKHAEYHIELLSLEGVKNGDRAVELAKKYGVDVLEIDKIIQEPAIDETIRRVYEVATELGISGTPSYVIGDKVVAGAIGYEELLNNVNQLTE